MCILRWSSAQLLLQNEAGADSSSMASSCFWCELIKRTSQGRSMACWCKIAGVADLVALGTHFHQSSNDFCLGQQTEEAEAGELLREAVGGYWHTGLCWHLHIQSFYLQAKHTSCPDA